MIHFPTTISPTGIQLIKSFHALSLEAHQEASGLWVIGYGHAIALDESFDDGLTVQEAEALLTVDLLRCKNALRKLVRVSLTQAQFDALISLIFSSGIEAFAQSVILKKINQHEFSQALSLWEKETTVNGREVAGLTLQRQAECALFQQAE